MSRSRMRGPIASYALPAYIWSGDAGGPKVIGRSLYDKLDLGAMDIGTVL